MALGTALLFLFGLFLALVTRNWHWSLGVLVYAALLPLLVAGLISLYRRYDLRCYAKAVRLWRAIKRGEIVVHFQPKVKADTGDLVAAEALARWQHPTRGLLPPAEFDLHVSNLAIRHAATWHQSGRPLMLSVNLSPSTLAREGIADELVELAEAHSYPPSLLDFEITEEISMDPGAATAELCRLKEYGIQLSLDDFGVGYSSMRRLAELPIDVVKIDRTFARGLDGSTAKSAVVGAAAILASTLNKHLVAEGIETPEVLHRVRELGCDVVQGYLIGPPLPADEFDAWVEERPTAGERFVRDLRAT